MHVLTYLDLLHSNNMNTKTGYSAFAHISHIIEDDATDQIVARSIRKWFVDYFWISHPCHKKKCVTADYFRWV